MSDQPTNPEHIPPSSVPSEEALLGGILSDATWFLEIVTFLSADDFFIARHMWIWEAFLSLRDQGLAIDNITVMKELSNRGQITDIGGSAYLTYLINSVDRTLHVVSYAKIVLYAAIRRRLLNAAGDVAMIANEENSPIERVLELSEMTIHMVTRIELPSSKKEKTFAESMDEYYDDLETLTREYDSGKTMSGIPTGLTDFDALTGGLQRGDLNILASRPSVGKSALAITIVLNIIMWSIKHNIPLRILIFSLEMNLKSLINRMVGIEAGLSSEKVRTGNLSKEDWSVFTFAYKRMRNYPIIIDDTPMISLEAMRTKARKVARMTDLPLSLVIVDYLQLMIPEKKRDRPDQEIAELSHGTKGLARELDVPILCLAQTNRDIDQRHKDDKTPRMSDLAGSMAIEQDADLITFLLREEMWNPNTDRLNQADWYLSKHRNGPTGVVPLFFRKEITHFSNLTTTKHSVAPYSPVQVGDHYGDEE